MHHVNLTPDTQSHVRLPDGTEMLRFRDNQATAVVTLTGGQRNALISSLFGSMTNDERLTLADELRADRDRGLWSK